MKKRPSPVKTSADRDPPPADGTSGFPIVGIGASAGGLKAFEEFFLAMPADSGMAFVLVQHLAPDQPSILCELISHYTSMQVFEVEDGMPVQANCVYIIPPNRDMALLKGTLQLIEPHSPRGQRLPIDFFFRSLAQDQHERAIGIVLSGTASDGTLGLSAIKGEGGMVMVQSPGSAEFDGMPRSAIATGLMDYELPPGGMPAKLMTYATHAFHNRARLTKAPTAEPKADAVLKKIFVIIRSFTGHDFSQYKPSTIRRRIERRMAVQEIETLNNYVRFLQQSPEEGIALFRELLIGVTNFFRDPEAFKFLEEQGIPKLFEGKPPGSTIRVWSAGCSTGEEAYSLAILLQERMEALGLSHTLQIFGTDMDSRAVATARAGRYPTNIAADISPGRLKRFFTPEPGGAAYRVHKSIRDLLIFSEHDLIKDPPFSKIDLVSCRNLLIYLNSDLQKRLIPLFHYTMNPDGMLFLGTSETVGRFDDLFAPLDRRAKLYRRKDPRNGARRRTMDQIVPQQPALNADHPRFVERAAPVAKLSPRELTEKAMVQQIVQASALVNERGDILYIHGRTGRYLELAPGDGGINNILKMAREGLRTELAVALHRAARGKEVVVSTGVHIKTNGDFSTINLTVSPVLADPSAMPEVPLYLVIMEEAPHEPEAGGQRSEDGGRKADARVVALNKKLLEKEEYLQSSLEDLESSAEELRSSNEELQSVNEELQSSNEELETAKEELQSNNEELHTVNNELQIKVVDLAQANNDINNLLVGTGIGTLFVDHQMRILRFTPPVAGIINLVPEDAGRPIHDFSTRLKKYSTLEEDIRDVLRSLVPVEREVQTSQDQWYLLRILPYRTTENVIEGATISFLDISEHKRGELVSAKLAAIVESSDDAIIGKDLDGIITSWNPGAERIFGYTAAEMVGTSILRLIPADRHQEEQDIQRQIKSGSRVEHFETLRQTKDGRLLDVSITASPIKDADGTVVGVSKVSRNITERKLAEELLRSSEVRYRELVDNLDAGVVAHAPDTSVVMSNSRALELLGLSEDQMTGRLAMDPEWKFLHEDHTPFLPEEYPVNRVIANKKAIKELVLGIVRPVSKDIVWVSVNGVPVFDQRGEILEVIVSFADITKRKQAEEEAQEFSERLKIAARAARLGIWDWDIANNNLTWDDTICEIYGVPHGGFVGGVEKWSEHLHPDDRDRVGIELQAAQRGEREYAPEFRIIWPDGSLHYIKANSQTFFDENGKPLRMVGSNIDITDRKKAEEALRSAKEAAESATRAKSDFLAMMTHELRTPLNGLMGFSELLSGTQLSDEQREYAQMINSSGMHLLGVINDLLDFSSIEHGRLHLYSAPFSIAGILESSMLTVRKSAIEKGLDLHSETGPGVPERMTGDERRACQILINLLGNAVKFTSTGSIVLHVAASTLGSLPAVDFSVEDTGVGISAEALGRLFQPFTQANSAIRRSFGGTGLGLSISQRLAEAMNGTLTVDSTLGKGSVFTLRLPLAAPDSSASNPSPAVPVHSEPTAPRGDLILVVEDDRASGVIAVKMLQSLGYHVEFVTNGAEAIEAFSPGKYSAILMDVALPVMDGLVATGKIREIEGASGHHVPIIAFTAQAMSGDREHCLAVGMDDFLAKPFKRAELAAKLACWQPPSHE